MNYTVLMTIVDGRETLSKEPSGESLFNLGLSYNVVEELTTLDIFHR